MSMTAEEFKNNLKGVVPVQLCPYTREGEVDIEGIKENTKFIVDFAKDGNKDVVLFTNGNTTEFYANSVEEQKNIIKTVVDTVGGVIPVITGVSQASARLTIEMAKYAEEVGADCAILLPPYVHTASKEGVYQYYKIVAESVNIGIMLYSHPGFGGTMLPPDLIARLAKIENIVAFKDCTLNVADYAFNSLIDPGDMILINGNAEISYVGSAAYGVKYRGFASAPIANFAPRLSYDIYEAVEAENFKKAYEALKKILPLENFIAKVTSSRQPIPGWVSVSNMYISIGKTAMNLVGLRGGTYNREQLPSEELTDEEKKELKGVLKEIGVI